MASAADVIEMFLTEDGEIARTLAAKLHDLNSDRRDTEADIARAIFEQCVEQPVTDLDAALVFAGEGWHRGVVGIVASRVVERFHRPAFVLGLENGLAQGSGRSIPVFHLLDALEAMPDLFGGHRQAAGITMDAARVEEFRQRLRVYAGERLTPADYERELAIDAEITLDEIDDGCIEDILRLAPFGFGNAAPTFAARGVEIAAPPDIIKEKHVFLKLKVAGRTIRAKAWNFAERAAELVPGTRLDIALQFEDDPYSAARGYSPWQAIVRDIREATVLATATSR
jgi:single-stranded-DNA-specific exonuclease